MAIHPGLDAPVPADTARVARAAIRVLNRLECVGETLRAALSALAREHPEWVQARVPKAWYARYGARFEAYRCPPPARNGPRWPRRSGRMGRNC